MLWVENGELKTLKGWFNANNLLKHLADVQARPNVVSVAVHLRYATSGATDVKTCHPFMTHYGLAVMHNGILYTPPKDYEGSDTQHYAHGRLNSLPAKWLFRERIWKVIKKETEGNRMLYVLPNYWRLSGNWHESDGIHYSNYSYLPSAQNDWLDWKGNDWQGGNDGELVLNPEDWELTWNEALSLADDLSLLYGLDVRTCYNRGFTSEELTECICEILYDINTGETS